VIDNAIVVSLAVGAKYAAPATGFLQVLASAGNRALVVTDCPASFAGAGVETLAYEPDGASVLHAKRHAVRAGLERAETVYYVDADHCLSDGAPVPRLGRLPAGIEAVGAIPLGRIQFNQLGAETQPELKKWLDPLVADWRSLLWWSDWLFVISRDAGAEAAFLAAWDRFAVWSAGKPAHPLVLGDGVAMALAAHACGWKPVARMLPLLTQAFQHLGYAGWKMDAPRL
jgi:hypothetical protein